MQPALGVSCEIGRVAVVGSGVMGSGIAAQIANAGIPVLLLDIVSKDAADRSSIARGAVERMLKTDPAPLMSPKNAPLITPGNLEDDIAKVADCDWVVEVVLERLDVKQDLYRKRRRRAVGRARRSPPTRRQSRWRR